jgi:hypothetical protein
MGGWYGKVSYRKRIRVFLDSIYLAQEKDKWWAVVKAVMNIRVP